jgi:GMP synthase (glutamine-hydrolysing)
VGRDDLRRLHRGEIAGLGLGELAAVLELDRFARRGSPERATVHFDAHASHCHPNVYIRHVEVLALVHGDGGGPSLFREVMAGRGDSVVEVRLHRGEQPGKPPSEYDALLVLGGTAHPYEEDTHAWLGPEVEYLEGALDQRVPTFGVCLGAELLARAAGGRVERAPEPEIGWFPVELTAAAEDDPLFSALPKHFPSFQWHEYSAGVPPGAVELARSGQGPQAYRLGHVVWGVQFHPEVRFEQLVGWIRSYGTRAPVPPERFVAEAKCHIEAWNEVGRKLFARFLDTAGEP